MIDTARREVTFFAAYPALFRELRPSLIDAHEKRKIRLNIAMAKEMLETEDLKGLDDARQLCCPVTLLISDAKLS